jgi:hypothetical protein
MEEYVVGKQLSGSVLCVSPGKFRCANAASPTI